tara:strand:- start:5440 stop:6501 length:1062 start_codon:yes stop_codon:yes gene_type:complete
MTESKFWKNNNKLSGLDIKYTEFIKKLAIKHGIKKLNNTSGLRDDAGVKNIYNQRINATNYGKVSNDMSGLTSAQKNIVKEAILRRDSSTGKLKYGRNNWSSFKKDLKDAGVSEVLAVTLRNKVGKIRGSFGGYQSGHLRGTKMDIYDPDKKLPKAFINDLKKVGFKILDDENSTEPAGVIDINFETSDPKLFKKILGETDVPSKKEAEIPYSPLTPQQLEAMGERQYQERQERKRRLLINQRKPASVKKTPEIKKKVKVESTSVLESIIRDRKIPKKKQQEKKEVKVESTNILESVIKDRKVPKKKEEFKGSFYDRKVLEAKARNVSRNEKKRLNEENIRKLSELGELGIRN